MASPSSGILRTPRQASQTFSLSGNAAPRPKNLFYVKFTKGGTASTTGTNAGSTSVSGQGGWQKDLSFLVKSVERPAINFTTEELNQYNKRRQVYTGYKTNPLKIVFYDTADSLAMQMFYEYSTTFFGDFNHAGSPGDFMYDVTTSNFLDSAGAGYGFAPKSVDPQSTDLNAQFFFNSISVYQVFKNQYLQFDIINPKISSFDPDDLSYEDSQVGLITMTVAYEAILFKNSAIPQAISGDSGLTESFQDLRLNGDVIDYPVDSGQPTSTPSGATSVQTQSTPAVNSANTTAPAQPQPASQTNSVGTGPLTAYGNYNFGTTAAAVSGTPGLNPGTDLSVMAALNPSLATNLNLIPPAPTADPGAQLMAQPNVQQDSIGQATYDAAAAAVSAAGSGNGKFDPSFVAASVVQGVLASGQIVGSTARDQVYNQSPSNVPTGAPNSWNSASTTGAALTPSTYAVMNAQRSATSQIGFNTRAAPSGGGIA